MKKIMREYSYVSYLPRDLIKYLPCHLCDCRTVKTYYGILARLRTLFFYKILMASNISSKEKHLKYFVSCDLWVLSPAFLLKPSADTEQWKSRYIAPVHGERVGRLLRSHIFTLWCIDFLMWLWNYAKFLCRPVLLVWWADTVICQRCLFFGCLLPQNRNQTSETVS